MKSEILNIIPKPKATLPLWVNFSVISSAILLCILGGIFLYFKLETASWQEKAKAKEAEYMALNNPENRAIEEEAGKISKQLENFSKAFLEKKPSFLVFDFLKANCHPNVVFGSFDFSCKSGELKIKGQADSYKILSEQILALKDIKEISNLKVSDISLSKEGKVTFNVGLFIKPAFFQTQNQ
ncbi:MAG: hypothetical protein PHE77_02100 [Candidatus Pacebacteria bacterium]|nr:hypothetical protein [Candidatus Paceibacterota bacterium]